MVGRRRRPRGVRKYQRETIMCVVARYFRVIAQSWLWLFGGDLAVAIFRLTCARRALSG